MVLARQRNGGKDKACRAMTLELDKVPSGLPPASTWIGTHTLLQHLNKNTNIYVHTCTYTCSNICTRILTYMYMYIFMYTQILMCMYVFIYIHTYTTKIPGVTKFCSAANDEWVTGHTCPH